ncbi:hypothetical protein HK099_002721, partial [Clydaea vesicula]
MHSSTKSAKVSSLSTESTGMNTSTPVTTILPAWPPVSDKKHHTTLGGGDSSVEMSPPKRKDLLNSFPTLKETKNYLASLVPACPSDGLIDTTHLDTFGTQCDKFLFPGTIYVKKKRSPIPLKVHVDSGASVLTISSTFVKRHKLHTLFGINQRVEFANKSIHDSNIYCKIKLTIQDFSSTFTAAVLPINDDLILGTTFFKAIRILELNWKTHIFSFVTANGDKHTWSPLIPLGKELNTPLT